MIGLTNKSAALMLTQFVDMARFYSLHDGLGRELNVRREVATWQVVGRDASNTSRVEFIVPAGVEVAMLGYWTARFEGELLGLRAVDLAFATYGVSSYVLPVGCVVESLRELSVF